MIVRENDGIVIKPSMWGSASHSRTLFLPDDTARCGKKQCGSGDSAAALYPHYKSFLNTFGIFLVLNRWPVTCSDFVQIHGLWNPGSCPITKWSPTGSFMIWSLPTFLVWCPSITQFSWLSEPHLLLVILNFLPQLLLGFCIYSLPYPEHIPLSRVFNSHWGLVEY